MLAIIIFAIVLVIVVVLLVKFGPLEYVEHAKLLWKTFSLWLGIAGTTVTGYLITFPQQAIDMWNQLPPDIKSFIPPRYMPLIGVALYVVGMVSKFIAQKKLQEQRAAITKDRI